MLLQIIDSTAKEEIVVGTCNLSEGAKAAVERAAFGGFLTRGHEPGTAEDRTGACELELHSPVGGETLTYRWPLFVGDERDESLEILETIRWVCRDVPELEKILGNNEVHAMYDPRSFQGMKRLCDRYNGAIGTLKQMRWISEKSPPTPSSSSSSSSSEFQFASTGLLKHILQVCYNKAVEDPDKLNQYEPFSPEVYGETSFELVHELMKVTKFGDEDVFVDLGSGVGQVVLQVAGSTPCKFCYGIEKSDWPAKYSECLSSEFTKWMSFFGKYHGKFRLEKGDFLGQDKVEVINSASIIFVNNFAFGPQVDHQLKLRFANVKEGARIVSSRAFCPLNFHITDRNLSDIGTIMKVEELTALPAAVSWTDKPFAYFLHTIDRSLLEKYFNNLKTCSETGVRRPLGTERNKRRHTNGGSLNGGSVKSESGDDVVRHKKPRKLPRGTLGEVDSGVESSIGNRSRKYAKKMLMDATNAGGGVVGKKFKLKKGSKKGFSMKRGRKKLNSSTLNTLDLFHRQTSSGSTSFDESSKTVFNEPWMTGSGGSATTPGGGHEGREERITASLLNGAFGPLKHLVSLYERQLMFFLQHMQSSTYREHLEMELESEKRRGAQLSARIAGLWSEVRLLGRAGSELLGRKMNDASVQGRARPGLAVVRDLVSETAARCDMERQASRLREHVAQLEREQQQLVAGHQHPRTNGNLPTLHDLLKVPKTVEPQRSPGPLVTSNTTSSSRAAEISGSTCRFEGDPVARSRSSLLSDLTEMLVRRSLQQGGARAVRPAAAPKKRAGAKGAEEGSAAPKKGRKKATVAIDDNNNDVAPESGARPVRPSSGPTADRQQQHQLQQPQQQQQQKQQREPKAQKPQQQRKKQARPLQVPGEQTEKSRADVDDRSFQAPFLSKLATPNFAVVDFSQLVNGGRTGQDRPASRPPSAFPLPPPPPNFMLFKPAAPPSLGGPVPTVMMTKPLFSSLAPSTSGGAQPRSVPSYVSFSSPLLSLPLFQPSALANRPAVAQDSSSSSSSPGSVQFGDRDPQRFLGERKEIVVVQ